MQGNLINKKAAMELSIGTVVVIVLAMSMLVLGLVLVRSIFSISEETVGEIDNKLKSELTELFSEDDKNVVVRAGSDGIVSLEAGSDLSGVAIAAQTPDGSSVTGDRLQYKVYLQPENAKNCLGIIGQGDTEDIFQGPLDTYQRFDEAEGPSAFARILVQVPDGTSECSQKVYVDVIDTANQDAFIGSSSFVMSIERAGFF